MPDFLTRLPEEPPGDDYEETVAAWIRERDPERAETLYRTQVFPRSCSRVREARQEVPPLDLLFVPVGTQPFAPTLAVLGNPAACVALLETPESAPYGLQVEQATAPELGDTLFLHVQVDPTNVSDIAYRMRDVFDVRGLPGRVGADVTGGKKVTTAAIAGVGSLYGWRLFYVDGEPVREKRMYSHHERIVEMGNVLDVFDDRRREHALGLLRAGAFLPAAREFRRLARRSLASLSDRRRARLALAAHALRQGDPHELGARLPGAARALDHSFGPEVLDLVRSAAEAPDARAALAWLGARLRYAEGDAVGSAALARTAARLLERPATEGESARTLLIRLRRQDEIRRRLPALRELNRTLGRGLRKLDH